MSFLLTREATQPSGPDFFEIFTVNSSYPITRLKWYSFLPTFVFSWSFGPSKFERKLHWQIIVNKVTYMKCVDHVLMFMIEILNLQLNWFWWVSGDGVAATNSEPLDI